MPKTAYTTTEEYILDTFPDSPNFGIRSLTFVNKKTGDIIDNAISLDSNGELTFRDKATEVSLKDLITRSKGYIEEKNQNGEPVLYFFDNQNEKVSLGALFEKLFLSNLAKGIRWFEGRAWENLSGECAKMDEYIVENFWIEETRKDVDDPTVVETLKKDNGSWKNIWHDVPCMEIITDDYVDNKYGNISTVIHYRIKADRPITTGFRIYDATADVELARSVHVAGGTDANAYVTYSVPVDYQGPMPDTPFTTESECKKITFRDLQNIQVLEGKEAGTGISSQDGYALVPLTKHVIKVQWSTCELAIQFDNLGNRVGDFNREFFESGDTSLDMVVFNNNSSPEDRTQLADRIEINTLNAEQKDKKEVEVTFDIVPFNDADDYSVTMGTNANFNAWVTVKNERGFTIQWDRTPIDGIIDWSLYHSERVENELDRLNNTTRVINHYLFGNREDNVDFCQEVERPDTEEEDCTAIYLEDNSAYIHDLMLTRIIPVVNRIEADFNNNESTAKELSDAIDDLQALLDTYNPPFVIYEWVMQVMAVLEDWRQKVYTYESIDDAIEAQGICTTIGYTYDILNIEESSTGTATLGGGTKPATTQVGLNFILDSEFDNGISNWDSGNMISGANNAILTWENSNSLKIQNVSGPGIAGEGSAEYDSLQLSVGTYEFSSDLLSEPISGGTACVRLVEQPETEPPVVIFEAKPGEVFNFAIQDPTTVKLQIYISDCDGMGVNDDCIIVDNVRLIKTSEEIDCEFEDPEGCCYPYYPYYPYCSPFEPPEFPPCPFEYRVLLDLTCADITSTQEVIICTPIVIELPPVPPPPQPPPPTPFCELDLRNFVADLSSTECECCDCCDTDNIEVKWRVDPTTGSPVIPESDSHIYFIEDDYGDRRYSTDKTVLRYIIETDNQSSCNVEYDGTESVEPFDIRAVKIFVDNTSGTECGILDAEDYEFVGVEKLMYQFATIAENPCEISFLPPNMVGVNLESMYGFDHTFKSLDITTDIQFIQHAEAISDMVEGRMTLLETDKTQSPDLLPVQNVSSNLLLVEPKQDDDYYGKIFDANGIELKMFNPLDVNSLLIRFNSFLGSPAMGSTVVWFDPRPNIVITPEERALYPGYDPIYSKTTKQEILEHIYSTVYPTERVPVFPNFKIGDFVVNGALYNPMYDIRNYRMPGIYTTNTFQQVTDGDLFRTKEVLETNGLRIGQYLKLTDGETNDYVVIRRDTFNTIPYRTSISNGVINLVTPSGIRFEIVSEETYNLNVEEAP
jgi:hypothetical protein